QKNQFPPGISPPFFALSLQEGFGPEPGAHPADGNDRPLRSAVSRRRFPEPPWIDPSEPHRRAALPERPAPAGTTEAAGESIRFRPAHVTGRSAEPPTRTLSQGAVMAVPKSTYLVLDVYKQIANRFWDLHHIKLHEHTDSMSLVGPSVGKGITFVPV